MVAAARRPRRPPAHLRRRASAQAAVNRIEDGTHLMGASTRSVLEYVDSRSTILACAARRFTADCM